MYTYETFPGQTIVRRKPDGYSAREILAELDQHGEGVIVLADDSDPDDFLSALEGAVCGNFRLNEYPID